MSDPIRITSPGDFIAAIPSLLGFHPEQSFVAVRVTEPGDRVAWTMRVDLESPVEEVSRQLLDLVSRTGTGRLLLAAFTDSADDTSRPALMTGILDDLDTADVHVQDALVVGGGVRYWSLLCQDPTCCPPEGREVPEGTSVFEATRVAGGARAVAASREELAGSYRLRPDLQPTPDDFNRAAVLLTGDMWQRADTAKSLLTCLHDPDKPDGDIGAAGLMLLLQDVHVRDLTLGAVITGPDPEGPVDTLAQVALRAPEELRPRLAGAAAAAMAATGANAVGSWAMVDHAGEDSLARLISVALHTCIEPSVIAASFAEGVAVLIANDPPAPAAM